MAAVADTVDLSQDTGVPSSDSSDDSSSSSSGSDSECDCSECERNKEQKSKKRWDLQWGKEDLLGGVLWEVYQGLWLVL